MPLSNYRRNNSLQQYFEAITPASLQAPAGLYLLVIENLRMLNLAYGHERADEIIAQLCEALAISVKAKVFHITDTQIALITSSIDDNREVMAEIRKCISRFGRGEGNHSAHIYCLSGYKEFEPELAPQKNLEELYAITCRTNLSEWNDDTAQQSRAKMAIAHEVHEALENKMLTLAYQPIIEAKTGTTHHYECLLRVLDEKGNPTSAGNFIQIAERMGIIENIDIRVLDMVFDKLEQDKQISLSLNISNLTIGSIAWRTRFFERITPQIAKRLMVEVTETAVMHDLRLTAFFIATLQEAGCTVALDDFGSGYTSFRQIRSLSLDYVKIDGSLIQDIVNNHHNRLLVKSLIDFLKGLNLKTIAEFVDGGDTAKFLIDCGIDYMQGNYFGSASTKLAI